MQITIACVAELYSDPNFKTMTAEYSLHANPAMPPPQFKQSDYQAREDLGMLDCWSVRANGLLVGFMSFLTAPSLHFGDGLGIVESLFVMKGHRMSGAGLKLIRTAKEHAKNRHMKVVVVQCPYGAPLAKLLEKESFTPEIICYCFNP